MEMEIEGDSGLYQVQASLEVARKYLEETLEVGKLVSVSHLYLSTEEGFEQI